MRDADAGSMVGFGILGPLTVRVDGQPVELGPLKQQQVLAMLLCRANSVVSVDTLTETLWGDRPPRTARKNLQVYIACLRKLLGCSGSDDRIIHRAGGYLLRAAADELDLLRFQESVNAARAAADQPASVGCLAAALGLWRGRALDGLTAGSELGAEVDRLAMRYLAVFEEWADGELGLGRAARVVEQLCDLAAQYPFRERLRQLQMSALSLAGRQAEALSAFDELRQALARELGLSPSPATEKLYLAMLNGSPTSTPAPRPAAPAPRPRMVLPPDLADFTGRAAPFGELARALSHGGMAVLSGPVGVGKTTLAVHAAHQLAQRFPDGQLFVGLRTEHGIVRPARAVLLDLLRLVGQEAPDGCETEELANRWQSWLLDRRVLLVLDDAGGPAVPRAVLPLSGTSAVIATSRRRLAGLEHASQVELAPFEPAEAVELLGRIVGAGRVGADPAAAGRVVEAVGWLPLAVRTAGVKLRLLRHVSLAEFASRLEQPDELLDELSTADSVLRPRLAAGLLDLPDSEREALCQLATIGTRCFTVDEALPVVGGGSARVRRLLESLFAANLLTVPSAEVTAHEALYELPGLLRCYVREMASASR